LVLGRWLPGVLASCSLAGCTWTNCSTIQPGALPAEEGTYVHAHQLVQMNKAEADDFVIYKSEFCDNGTKLGPFGTYRFGQMVRRLAEVPFPIVIQPAQDLALDEARRAAIVARLASVGVPNPEARVVIAYPEAEGLYGEEAEGIYEAMLFSQGYNQFGGGFGRNIFPGFSGLGGYGGGVPAGIGFFP
jgi:hypothetical protein